MMPQAEQLELEALRHTLKNECFSHIHPWQMNRFMERLDSIDIRQHDAIEKFARLILVFSRCDTEKRLNNFDVVKFLNNKFQDEKSDREIRDLLDNSTELFSIVELCLIKARNALVQSDYPDFHAQNNEQLADKGRKIMERELQALSAPISMDDSVFMWTAFRKLVHSDARQLPDMYWDSSNSPRKCSWSDQVPNNQNLRNQIDSISEESLKTTDGKRDLLEWAAILSEAIRNSSRNMQRQYLLPEREIRFDRIQEKKESLKIATPGASGVYENYAQLHANLLEAAKKYLSGKGETSAFTGKERVAGKLRAENLIAQLEAIHIANPELVANPEFVDRREVERKLLEQQRELILLAACIVCPLKNEWEDQLKVNRSTRGIKKTILDQTKRSEMQFGNLRERMLISDRELLRRTNALNESRELADDSISNLNSRLDKLIERVTNYKDSINSSPTDEGHIRARHFLMALKEIKAEAKLDGGLSQIELQRKLYELVYLLTFTTSAELNASVLAAFGWVEKNLQEAVEKTASLFGDIELSHKFSSIGIEWRSEARQMANLAFGEDKKDAVQQAYEAPRELHVGGTTAELEAAFNSQDADSEILIQKLEKIIKPEDPKSEDPKPKDVKPGENSLPKYYNPHDLLSNARVKNIKMELEEIKALSVEVEKKRRLLTLMCAVVFKSGSSELANLIGAQFNSPGQSDGKVQLKKLQLSAGISDYAAVKKSEEVNALARVPDWGAFKQQVMDALEAYRRSGVGQKAGDVIAQAAQKELNALKLPPGNFSHVDQYNILSFIARLQKHHGENYPDLIESIMVFISTSGIDTNALEVLKNQYKASDEVTVPAASSVAYNRLCYDVKCRMSYAELILMGSKKPEVRLLQAKFLVDLQEIETSLMGDPSQSASCEQRFFNLVRDHSSKLEPYFRKKDSIVDQSGNSDDHLGVILEQSDVEVTLRSAAAASIEISPEDNSKRSQLFVNFKIALSRAAKSYLMTDLGLGHGGGKLRAQNFQAALNAIPSPMDEKGHKYLILLAASVSTGAGSKTLAGGFTTFCTKVLISVGMTTENMDLLRKFFDITDKALASTIEALQTVEKASFAYPQPLDWKIFYADFKKAIANYNIGSVINTFGAKRKKILLAELEEITCLSDIEHQKKLAAFACTVAIHLDSNTLKKAVRDLFPDSSLTFELLQLEFNITKHNCEEVIKKLEHNPKNKPTELAVPASIANTAAARLFPAVLISCPQEIEGISNWVDFRDKLRAALIKPFDKSTFSTDDTLARENLQGRLAKISDAVNSDPKLQKQLLELSCTAVCSKNFPSLSSHITQETGIVLTAFENLAKSNGVSGREYRQIRGVLTAVRNEQMMEVKPV